MQPHFLYPFSFAIGRTDFAWWWASGLHFVSALVLFLLVPAGLVMWLCILGGISLRGIWDRQAIFRESAALVADATGQWFLLSSTGVRNNVRLKSVSLCLSLIIIEVERFGSSSYLLQIQSRVSEEQVHRVRLLSQYF